VAYDEGLAARLREVVAGEADLTEKRMFGGVAFLLGGNMAVSASGQGDVLLRVDPAETDALVAEPHARRAVMRGRPMDGWLRLDARALGDDELNRWIARGVDYARSLPPK
jgi:TfoX/Sxy family transcriptional regulator of competence genes